MANDKKTKRPASKYARKKEWLNSNGKWGFQVPEPKPWKGGD